MNLSNNIRINISLTLTGTSGAARLKGKIGETVATTLAGTDAVYSYSGNTAQSFDLADGTLDGPLGDAVTFDDVQLIYLYNKSETNTLTLGGGTDDITVLSGGLSVPAGGVAILIAGYAVGEGVDQITVSGTTTDGYDLIVIGTQPE